jgi:hypothetical protein
MHLVLADVVQSKILFRGVVMEDSPRTQLEAQIAQEKAELEAVPKIPIQQFMGTSLRCHLCGRVVPINDLQPFDQHIPNTPPRMACSQCHPMRGQNG